MPARRAEDKEQLPESRNRSAPTVRRVPPKKIPQPHGGALNRGRGKKLPTETPAPTSVPQPHGGALQIGNPGNKGGLGTPPSLIRAGLRGSYQQRMAFLESVVDGDVITQTEVPLALILPHVHCAQCAYRVAPKDVEDQFLLMIPAKVSPSVKDRLAALDQMARYGMGTLKEVSVDNVRERVSQTLDIIRGLVTPEQAEILFRAIEPVWA